MQRANIKGADLKPCARQTNGINAEKCVRYLRGIGVEIDDATAESWLDTQAVHRMLAKMARENTIVNKWMCKCGEMEGFTMTVKGRTLRPKKRKNSESTGPSVCESCHTSWVCMVRVFSVRNDGLYEDYRAASERWQPIETFAKEIMSLIREAL
jgi:hypothetical protein